MAVSLPKYGLTVPSETSRFRDLGKELREMGLALEDILESFDYTGADPNLVLSRVAALEAWRTATESWVSTTQTWMDNRSGGLFSARLSSPQSLSGSWSQIVNLSTVKNEIGVTMSGGAVTLPRAGLILFNATWQHSGGANNALSHAVTLNATTVGTGESTIIDGAITGNGFARAMFLPVSAGSVLRLFAAASGTVSATIKTGIDVTYV